MLCTAANCGSTTTECTSTNCVVGYGMYIAADKVCRQCADNASACDAAPETAITCKDGYYYDSAVCKKCPTDAATCSDATTITVCVAGKSKIGADTTCTDCTATNASACTT